MNSTVSKFQLFECNDEVGQALFNWLAINRKSFSRMEMETLRKRMILIHRRVGNALVEKSEIIESLVELEQVKAELTDLVMEVNCKIKSGEMLGKELEEYSMKLITMLNAYKQSISRGGIGIEQSNPQ